MNYTEKPIMIIDQKKKRICIPNSTLELLGNPQYIQILANLKKGILIIKCCEKNSLAALNLKYLKKANGELYSTNLKNIFYDICSKWEASVVYIIIGELKNKGELACFVMKNAEHYRELEVHNYESYDTRTEN